MKKEDDNWPYGDDPNAAEFPGLTAKDIKGKTHEVTLTVGQKKIIKNASTDTVRR